VLPGSLAFNIDDSLRSRKWERPGWISGRKFSGYTTPLPGMRAHSIARRTMRCGGVRVCLAMAPIPEHIILSHDCNHPTHPCDNDTEDAEPILSSQPAIWELVGSGEFNRSTGGREFAATVKASQACGECQSEPSGASKPNMYRQTAKKKKKAGSSTMTQCDVESKT
jgi:hypothetical protein